MSVKKSQVKKNTEEDQVQDQAMPKIITNHRVFQDIKPAAAAAAAPTDQTDPPSGPPVLTTSKKVIAPLHDIAPDPKEETPTPEETDSSAVATDPVENKKEAPAPEPSASDTSKDADQAIETPQEATVKTEEPVESEISTTTGTSPSAKRPTVEAMKAVADAEHAAQREKELEEYISKRTFFVPVNSVAQKKTIRMSFGLILVIALLGAILIDLMLDSGIILLVQKIPHTHFFSVITH